MTECELECERKSECEYKEEREKICPIMKGECLGQQCEFWNEKNNISMCAIPLAKDLMGCVASKLLDIENLLSSINKNLVKQSTKMPKSKEKKKTTKKSR